MTYDMKFKMQICKNIVQLKPFSIINVPLQIYDQDFTFVVNGKEFKTNRLISDILSPKISQIHINDPTFSVFTLNSHYNGDFSHILNLLDFKKNEIPISEFPFVSEVIEILGNEHIEIFNTEKKLTINNVIELVHQHEKFPQFYSNSLQNEIEFISNNFTQICENSIEEFRKLNIDTILSILSNENLQLEDEDQLLKIVNDFYLIDSKYSPLYEKVHFVNISNKAMKEFIDVFDFKDISGETWKKLSQRLIEGIDKKYSKSGTKLNEEGITFSIEQTKLLSGIINYLSSKKSNNEISITSSSHFLNDDRYQPQNVVILDNNEICFLSKNLPNSWICFDFKDHYVHPTDYIIRSPKNEITNHYLRNWVIEGCNDNQSWEILDRQENCDFLNGSEFIHTFTLNNQNVKEYRYIRLRQTGPNVFNQDFLAIKNIEIYGNLI